MMMAVMLNGSEGATGVLMGSIVVVLDGIFDGLLLRSSCAVILMY